MRIPATAMMLSMLLLLIFCIQDIAALPTEASDNLWKHMTRDKLSSRRDPYGLLSTVSTLFGDTDMAVRWGEGGKSTLSGWTKRDIKSMKCFILGRPTEMIDYY
ncbi:uncharacterized protein J4E88_009742 [Alternaria novae-zelandiae]|uniref:uncharacterized protein n=1 Tax=Alternaria novae-zelandiae TaxID=430562 RepID=UPI0020C2630B|nr:uncharacterized protein J4E88_009742 [Alternaria novae-zelandiae]KAI4670650.1 hypothetical protein J4E88_009742 [Alternaria novae-zelandiae]